jgi:hypothetical protein
MPFSFVNNDTLLQSQNLPANGTYFDDRIISLLSGSYYDISQIPTTGINLELHAYDLVGNYLTGMNNSVSWSLQSGPTASYNLSIDVNSSLEQIGLLRGQYLLGINLQKPEIGNYNNKAFYIKEISTTRRELRLYPVDENNTQFQTEYTTFVNDWTNTIFNAIDDSNRIVNRFNTSSILYDTNINFFPPITFAEPKISFRPAIDISPELNEITGQINNTQYFSNTNNNLVLVGATLQDKSNTYKLLIEESQTEWALIASWFKAADIEVSKQNLATFKNELIAYIQEYRLSAANTNSVLSSTDILNLYNRYPLREFWKRELDVNVNYIHLGKSYFTSVATISTPGGLVTFIPSTISKAGYRVTNIYPSNKVLNFGNNNLAKIINIAKEDPYSIIIKLAQPLDLQFQEYDRLWIATELIDPLIDKILLINLIVQQIGNNLRGPNFDIDIEEAQSIATSLQSWNDLLSANVATNQQIINKYFSSSLDGIALNIDYTDFKNFIHFSSAEERVSNFKYKLELIEYYTNRINVLNSSTGSLLDINVLESDSNRNKIIAGFDDFEKYLFYQTNDTYQLYTFETGSILPWPKQNVANLYISYENQVSTTSSIAETYFSDLLQQAQTYDSYNLHSLRKTIPVHLQDDQFNADYILFVDMIGHYYDIIWSYINDMTKINTRLENPRDGVSNDLIYGIAKSLGLDVYNGRNIQELWKYSLGVDTSGSYIQTGSIQSLSYEQGTKEVWRRVINNLPYLYKTKGTARSIKALLSCYGIPTSILNIREYGGVASDENDLFPYWTHDIFTYAHKATGDDSNYVITPWQAFTKVTKDLPAGYQTSSLVVPTITTGTMTVPTTVTIPTVGIQTGVTSTINLPIANLASPIINRSTETQSTQYPDVIEFRFRTDDNFTYVYNQEYSLLRLNSVNYQFTPQTWSQIQTQWNQTNLLWGYASASLPVANPFFEVTLKRTTDKQGTLTLYMSGSGGFLSASIENVYLFNNEWITAAVQRGISTDVTSSSNQSYTLKYQRGYYGKIVQTGSAAIDLSTVSSSGSYNAIWTSQSGSYIGFGQGGLNTAVSGNYSNKFNGFYQELRYWYGTLSDYAISNHTLSPNSYNGNEHFSAYYDLLFRTSLSRKDLVINGTFGYQQQLSHHPNQNINTGTSAIFVNRIGVDSVPFEGVEDTYYTLYADLTSKVISSEKIRIQSQSLNGTALQTDKRVTISSLDKNSNDSNKLGIFFSPQTGINEDIVNHLGYISLDDYIGDPRHAYDYKYKTLVELSSEYWKKYNNKNDFEAYFRALQIYDLSIFRQIKKFVPARANLISGILIEPNLLERSKARIVRNLVVDDVAYVVPRRPILGQPGSVGLPTFVYEPNIEVAGEIGVLTNTDGIVQNGTAASGVVPQSGIATASINPSATHIGTTTQIGGQYILPTISTNVITGVTMNTTTNTTMSDRFNIGTRSVSAGINIPSLDTVDGGPVVLITQVNRTQIYTQPLASTGNLRIG